MKKIIALLVIAVFMNSFVANQMVVKGAESNKIAIELCKSANTWEEYKDIFEDFQCERKDFIGRTLKKLPQEIEGLSTFTKISYGIKDEEADELADAIQYATSLYSNSEIGHLRFSIEKEDLNSPYSQIDIVVEDNPLTHIGNAVKCAGVPYYSNIDQYRAGKNMNYYKGQGICYTCGVAYWNPNGTLEKMEYIPYNEVGQLNDTQKLKIDKSFDGTILILLCTTDTLLGWTSIDGLFQYEDAMGNMTFYNPEFLYYK